MVSQRVTAEFHDEPLLFSRLHPPPQQRRLLRRPRVAAALASAFEYPLTLLNAPAGSGKTTALATFVTQSGWPVAWCRARAEDTPALLLRHLVAAFRPTVTLDESQISTLLGRDDLAGALDQFANQLVLTLHDETLLVLDDYHFIDATPHCAALVEHLRANQPGRLHLLCAGRVVPTLPELMRMRGETYELGQTDLAFDNDEAAALFSLNDLPIRLSLPSWSRGRVAGHWLCRWRSEENSGCRMQMQHSAAAAQRGAQPRQRHSHGWR
ncbi:hypothetical protein HC891_19380 [Candidatus Gracilibacteria bacterium]|nr:hypothetical protein [Candidatus Gracilibacteria bacterium]